MTFRNYWLSLVKVSTLWVRSGDLQLLQLVNTVNNVVGRQLSAAEARQESFDVGLDDRVCLSRPPSKWECAWLRSKRLVASAPRSQGPGASCLPVTLNSPALAPTEPQQMHEHAARLVEADLFYPERRVRALPSNRQIEASLLAESFAAYADTNRLRSHGSANTQLGSGRWPERVHALVAALIADELCDRR